MAYRITQSCISCGTCANACPVYAISAGLHGYEIDPDVCVSCGCCADECPIGAIEEAAGGFPPAGFPEMSSSEHSGSTPGETTERFPEES